MSEQIRESYDGDNKEVDILFDNIVMEDAECEPAPRHLDPLFQQIYEVERKVSQHRFPTREEALQFASQQAAVFNQALDEAGLLDEPVFFDSTEVIRPTVRFDPTTTECTLGPPEPEQAADGALLPTSEALPETGSGDLAYIGYIVVTEANGDDETSCRVAFTYAVNAVPIQTTFGTIIPRVQVPISGSSIEYFADRHMRGAREALDVLLRHDSLEVIMHVNDLNLHLTDPNEALIPPYVSEKVRAIHEHEGITQIYSDALLSLISQYIAPRGEQAFRATASYEPDGQGGMKPVPIEGDALVYEQKAETIVILPRFDEVVLENGETARAEGMDIYFVMEVGGVMHYVPFSAIMLGDDYA